MFRIQNNVPEVYVQESRDFQLFSRLYDSLLNGVKYSVDSLSHTSNTLECNNSVLHLLATKLGLFTSMSLPDTELRYILTAFPHIIRYKGSKRSIDYTVRVFQRVSKQEDLTYTVMIDNVSKEIGLIFNEDILNEDLLYELLSFITPTGYSCEYRVFKNPYPTTTVKVSSDKVTTEKIKNEDLLVSDESVVGLATTQIDEQGGNTDA